MDITSAFVLKQQNGHAFSATKTVGAENAAIMNLEATRRNVMMVTSKCMFRNILMPRQMDML